MTLFKLLRRNLVFHRRGNLAVLLGVAVGTAVLTGALLVGDSLRGSLRDRALRRLGQVDYALAANRLFRESVARDFAIDGVSVNAIIMLRAAVSAGDRRVNGVTLFDALKARILAGPPPSSLRMPPWRPWHVIPALRPKSYLIWDDVPPTFDGAELPVLIAEKLGVRPDERIRIHVQKSSAIPRESLLGRRGADDAVESFELPFSRYRTDQAAEFSLRPGPREVRNVFIGDPQLWSKLGLTGRANTILVQGGDLATLNERLQKALTLDDWGLVIHHPSEETGSLFAMLDRNKDETLQPSEWRNRLAESVARAADRTPHPTPDAPPTPKRGDLLEYYRHRGYISVESRSLLIEPAVERTALEVTKEMGLRAAPTLVYLANSISDGKQSIPYSIVAALDPQLPPPLGPLLPSNEKPLADDEILLAEWPESPIKPKPGDSITLTYFEPEQEGRLKETSKTFRLRGFVPLAGVAADPDLTPAFPGITDKLTLGDWDPPFPYDNKRVQKRDEDFWAQYRGTPKAYVNLAVGRKLFGSRFGQATSIRLAPATPTDLDQLAKDFGERLRKALRPELGGFVFEDVRARALAASTGGQDFGMLFLGFSFFLIAAALVLVGLLVRLNIDRRASEIGLLMASGYRVRTVRRLLLAEGMTLAFFGALLGLAGAVGYAALMLKLLADLWPSGEVASFLELHVTGQSLAIGFVAALAVSGLTIWWAVRVLRRVAPSALIAGMTTQEGAIAVAPHSRKRKVLLFGSLLFGMVSVVAGLFVRDHEAQAGSFFTGGLLLLTAALTAVLSWMKAPRHATIAPGAPFAVARLGGRNAVRNPTRSLLTAALLASAAFLLVAVESFRRSPDADFLDKNGGSDGFALVGESDLPIYQDPNTGPGRQELLDALERQYQSRPGAMPADTKAKLAAATALLSQTTIVPLRLKAGDDASCLNLYQPGKPRLLGVPRALMVRDGFRFADHRLRHTGYNLSSLSRGITPFSRGNDLTPWFLLDGQDEDGSIPVFGEANTVQWMLKSGLEKSIEIPDEQGRPVKLLVVGLLQDSVFQSELLMSEANFLKLYPRQEGYSYFLIDAPRGREADVRDLLNIAFADRGLDVTFARDRLASFLAVENTYLSTFQVLGGFGLLLGASGLAVVLLRGVWERRGELALLRALGYRRRALGGMVFAENALLLVIGLAAGVGAALASVAPHILRGEGAVPWARLAGLLGLVLLVGLLSGGLAVRATLRAPLVPALRKE
jgi:ABC-type antimicrobial peptide transport system permease subunit